MRPIGLRRRDFSLPGAGTKRIPISRPLVLTDRNDRVLVVFRDQQRGGGISVAVSEDAARREWEIEDIWPEPIGMWEPTE